MLIDLSFLDMSGAKSVWRYTIKNGNKKQVSFYAKDKFSTQQSIRRFKEEAYWNICKYAMLW